MEAAVDRREVHQVRGTHFRVDLCVRLEWSSHVLGQLYSAVSVSLVHGHFTNTHRPVPYMRKKVL